MLYLLGTHRALGSIPVITTLKMITNNIVFVCVKREMSVVFFHLLLSQIKQIYCSFKPN